MDEPRKSEETKAAEEKLLKALIGMDMFGGPDRVLMAIDALVDAKITDAIEFMADRIEEKLGARP